MMINGKKNSLGTVTTTHLCQLSMFMGVHQELWAKAQNQHIGMIHTHTLSPPSFCLIPFLAPFPMIPHDTYPGVPVDIRSWSTWMCCIIIRNLNQTTTYFPGLGFNQFGKVKTSPDPQKQVYQIVYQNTKTPKPVRTHRGKQTCFPLTRCSVRPGHEMSRSLVCSPLGV